MFTRRPLPFGHKVSLPERLPGVPGNHNQRPSASSTHTTASPEPAKPLPWDLAGRMHFEAQPKGAVVKSDLVSVVFILFCFVT